jgi:fibro-slime domain-containing protein
MASSARFSFVSLLLFLVGAFSCSTGVDGDTTLETGGANNGGNGQGGNGSGGIPRPTGGTAGTIPVTGASCGDGVWQQGEACEDGNDIDGDCCTDFCQIEADCDCPDMAAGPCTSFAACGNGRLTSAEACDDGNMIDGDGCSADCKTVTPGWQCRVPGRKCVPFCGDGQMLGGENCDDGNAVSGDGCSSTCLTEPGWSCTGSPSTCSASVCGNGIVESGEGCDLGEEGNGLFYGDATGCSKTCTQEPNCRPNGTTQACSTFCGDGNIDTPDGEQCDDGNAVAGDGCSDTCQLEGGFMCGDMPAPDTEPCPSNPALQCLVLPVIYRDFAGQQEPNGHPDFFYMGAPASGGRLTGVIGGKTACVPNASGTRAVWNPGDACPNTDAVGACSGIAATALNALGKPDLAKDTCPCVFTDWDQTGVLQGVTGAVQCWVENEGSMRDRVQGDVKVVQSAESFAQWYTTSAMSTETRGTLELAQTGTQYQFSSSIPGAAAGAVGRTVVDDIHDNCLGTATPLQSGFFPLEAATGTGSTKLCNLWPYWKAGLNTTNCVATAGNPIQAQWDPLAAWDACPTTGTGGFVPNASGNGTLNGQPHNFYFTTEARYLFRYDAPAQLSFFGDDDVWVFVNGRLALDLGAPHERLMGTVTIDTTLGLEVGRIYEIAVFHADRHPRESNYQLTLSGFATTKSVCVPRCGDEITTLTEECDDGDAATDTDGIINMDGVYGGCDSQCHFGPFCGDGVVFEGLDPATGLPYEQCDLGRDNTATYGVIGGCSPSCQVTPACGDGFIDSAFGETCDDGPMNGMGSCTMACQKIVM